MTDRPGVVRVVLWRELFPWLLIARSFRLSLRPTILLLASLGVAITPLGWRCAEFLFVRGEPRLQAPGFAQMTERNRRWPEISVGARPGASGFPVPDESGWSAAWRGNIPSVFGQMIEPYRRLFSSDSLQVTHFAYIAFGGLWTLLVWSVIGGAITRVAVMRLGRDEGTGVIAAFLFVVKRLRSYVFAPIFPMLGISLLTFGAFFVGLLMRYDWGVFLASLLWGFVLLAGLVMTLLLVGVTCGWPLMWPAISAERGGDEFEALHRSFFYTFGQPLRYAYYALLAILLGGLGGIVVSQIASMVIYLSEWSVAWGMGFDRFAEVTDRLDQMRSGVRDVNTSGSLAAGLSVISFFERCVAILAAGFRYSFFWCAASAIYLVLRLDCDQAEFDEVFSEDDVQPRGLPILKKDEAGVPVVDETTTGT